MTGDGETLPVEVRASEEMVWLIRAIRSWAQAKTQTPSDREPPQEALRLALLRATNALHAEVVEMVTERIAALRAKRPR
jgi:hypothetical protein